MLLATSPSFSGWETGLAFNPPEGPHSGQQGVLPVFQVSSLRAKVSSAGVEGRIEGSDARSLLVRLHLLTRAASSDFSQVVTLPNPPGIFHCQRDIIEVTRLEPYK